MKQQGRQALTPPNSKPRIIVDTANEIVGNHTAPYPITQPSQKEVTQ